MKVPKAIRNLIESFERLPGIGPKTAQRLTFYLLHVPPEELNVFAESIKDLKARTKICSVCRNVGEEDPCEVCTDAKRDKSLIAVVESPLDVLAFEKTGFRGLYHVLHGVISPLNNIGPDDIFIHDLIKRLKSDSSGHGSFDLEIESSLDVHRTEKISEIILATNTSLEGESTSMYIMRLINELGDRAKELKVTRIARGLPVGGDIEYADEITLRRAIDGRVVY